MNSLERTKRCLCLVGGSLIWVLAVAGPCALAAEARFQPGLSETSVGRFGFNSDWGHPEGLLFGQITSRFIYSTCYGRKWRLYYSVASGDFARNAEWTEGRIGQWDWAEQDRQDVQAPDFDPTRGIGVGAESLPGRQRVLNLTWISALADSGLGYTLRYSVMAPGVVLESSEKVLNLAASPHFDYAAYVSGGKVCVVSLKDGNAVDVHDPDTRSYDENWLLLWAGREAATKAVAGETVPKDRFGNPLPHRGPAPIRPVLVVFQNRPVHIGGQEGGALSIRFEERIGRAILGAPFGRHTWSLEEAESWPRSFPADLRRQVTFWSRAFLAYPVDCDESFAFHRDANQIEIRNRVKFLITEDAWGTEPLKIAALPLLLPMIAKMTEFPAVLPKEATYLGCDGRVGELWGITDSDEISYRLPVPVIDFKVLPVIKNPDPLTASIRKPLLQYCRRKNNEYVWLLTESIENDYTSAHGPLMGGAWTWAKLWYDEETEQLAEKRSRLAIRALASPRTWRRFVDPASGRSFITEKYRDHNVRYGEPTSIDGRPVKTVDPSWKRRSFESGDYNNSVNPTWCGALNLFLLFDDHPELVDALRGNWDFIKNADLSYIKTLHHWDWMAASNQTKGGLGAGTDMLSDEIVGIAALRAAARTMGDREHEALCTYMQAKAAVPLIVRFAKGYRDWLVGHGVPLREDELPIMVGEFGWYQVEGEDTWCRMGARSLHREGYWDTNYYRRGDGVINDIGGVHGTTLGMLIHLAPDTVRWYAGDWYEKWNGPDWYSWQKGDTHLYPKYEYPALGSGQRLRDRVWASVRGSRIGRQLNLRQYLGWTGDQVWTAITESYAPETEAERDALGPITTAGGPRTSVLYARLPCWLAHWSPSFLTAAEYDMDSAVLTLALRAEDEPVAVDLLVKRLPTSIRVNGRILGDEGMCTPTVLPGYLRVETGAVGDVAMTVEF